MNAQKQKQSTAEVHAATVNARAMFADLAEGIESIRKRLLTLADSRRAVAEMPVPISEAIVRFDAWASQLQAEAIGRFPFFALTEPVMSGGDAAMPNGDDNFSKVIFAAAALRGLRDLVTGEMKARYAQQPGIGSEERAQQLDAIDREIFDLGLSEESLIRAAEMGGMEILRRADADPRAVLAADEALPQ